MIDLLRALKRRADRLFFDILRRLPSSGGEYAQPSMLVIRTDGIGDMVYFLRFAEEIKARTPARRLFLVCRTSSASVVPEGIFDAIIPFRYMAYRWNYLYRMVILARIRRLRPATALYSSYHRQHIGDEMALCSGASRSVAFVGNDEIIDPGIRIRNNTLYSRILNVEDHVPEQLRYEVMLKALGVEGKGGAAQTKLPEESFEELQRLLPGISRHGYVVLGPGGSAPIRRWPSLHFSALGDSLSGQNGMPVVLCGNQQERSLLEEIASGMTRRPLVLCGSDLPLVVQLIRSANMFVGNESGLLHIAATCGTPAVGILGGGHFARYFPYGSAQIVNHQLDCYECNWNCPFPEPYCLTRITVENVVGKMKEMLTG